MSDLIQSQFQMQMLHGGCDTALFIASGYHNRQQLKSGLLARMGAS